MQVTEAPGTSRAPAQPVGATFASRTPTAPTVTVPVFVTTKVYATVSPASVRPLRLASTGVPAVLSSTSVARAASGVLVVSVGDVVRVPVGVSPDTVALLSTTPRPGRPG